MRSKRKRPSVRRSRTRTRKPKFLSLSKHIKSPPSSSISSNKTTPSRHQLTLFPLHPENLVDDKSFGDENVALLFHTESVPGDGSLTGLLQTASSEEQEESLSYDRLRDGNDNDSLVKAAMKRRNGERDAGEEKWVCYSEVVEEATSASSSMGVKKKKKKSKKRGETTSSSSGSQEGNSLSSLALKLDYQEILKAWSDKGSLYIGEDLSPQTVPDLQYDHHGLMDGWGSSAGNLWKVPESGGLKSNEEMEGKDGRRVGQREASVLRYKEKRRSRLFAKQIRYQVRKLNAEKRPRMKGRFVKIS